MILIIWVVNLLENIKTRLKLIELGCISSELYKQLINNK